MRSIKGSILGLVLCWTVVCTGIQAQWESNEDTVPSSVEDILDLLKREELFLNEGGKETVGDCDCGVGTCDFDDDGKKVCTCGDKTKEHDGICKDFDCGVGTCDFDADGKKVCTCPAKTKEHNGICKDCDCGVGTCDFDADGKKVCTCPAKTKEHDGICKECDCGDANCELDVQGKKKDCVCTKNQKEFGGKCFDCDCGEATCELDNAGKKVCTCPDKKKEHDGKCIECDCGDASCDLDDNGRKKNCVCTAKQQMHDGKCVACDCGDAVCKLDGSGKKKECECNAKQKKHDGKCVGCDCGDATCELDDSGTKQKCKCTESQREEKDGKCSEIKTCEKTGTAVCDSKKRICEDKKSADFECGACIGTHAEDGNKNCRETCDKVVEGDCKHNGTCNESRFCDCLKGFSGDKCEVVDECETGKYINCKGPNGKCSFVDVEGKAVCECGDDTKALNEKENICRTKCTEDKECNNGKCTESKFCQCEKGYSGDICNIIKGCDELKCNADYATCKYDKSKDEAYCDCNDSNYAFDNGNCNTAKWCKEKPCKDAECVFKDGIGSCKCSAADTYYDFRQGGCKKIDPCLLKPRDGNKECDSVSGAYKCIAGFELKDDKCERKNVCTVNKCFKGATCEEGDKPNVVKCSCKPNEFYTKEGCADASCFLNGKNCSNCPSGMKKNKEDCEHEEGKKCDKECGFGWCIKGEKEDKCVCRDSKYTELKAGKCVLKVSTCTGILATADPSVCNCTGMYKMAQNEITCERKSCADKDAQEDCKRKKAKCVDEWKNPKKSYSCKCDDGYVPDSETEICTDQCSLKKSKDACANNNQVCFLKNTADFDCKCQPTFALNEKRCVPTDQGLDVMLHTLPVKSDRYRLEGSIDYVKLNKDIINAMEAIYPKTELASARLYKYKSKNDNVLLCEVWLQFNKDAPKQVDRWKVQKASTNGSIFLPPALLLSSDQEVNGVKHETLTFCSVKDTHCGQVAGCSGKTCSCDSGYRVIESTVRKYGDFVSLYCEDINECTEGSHRCFENTTCVNTLGDYYCKCKVGFKKSEGLADEENKNSCTDLCSPSPCGKGKCSHVNDTVDCTCDPGYGGSFCNKEDLNFKSASKNTVVVGAVLGTLLGVLIILFVLYILRQRKNSYSEDFTPAPRIDNAEMVDRRPMRGVTNRAYQ